MDEYRRILHIDLDAFYCAVEELRDRNLKGLPFAVGGRPDQRGVVASCSYAARKFGVRSAMPMAQAVKICPQLRIIKSDFRAYSKASAQVMGYLREYTDQVEQISIDEAFIDISKLPFSSDQFAKLIQDHINSEFGLPCSIGIAANKLVAKVATDYGKVAQGLSDHPPNAIFIVPHGTEEAFLRPLPVHSLWGIGPKTAEKLKALNINTLGELTQFPENELLEKFGKWGYVIAQRARGIDDRPLVLKHVAKSISQETTFSRDLTKENDLVETISKLAKRVSLRMKRKHVQGTTIKIKLRRSDFSTVTRQVTIQQPANDNEIISYHAVSLFKKEWKAGEPIRLIGVGVSGLAPEQLSLWDHQDNSETHEKNFQLKTAIQELRNKFGEEVLKWGDQVPEDDS